MVNSPFPCKNMTCICQIELNFSSLEFYTSTKSIIVPVSLNEERSSSQTCCLEVPETRMQRFKETVRKYRGKYLDMKIEIKELSEEKRRVEI